MIGYPRLVRLNPNIPWKTRGNGALAFQIGGGYGERTLIGEIDRKKIISYKKKRYDKKIPSGILNSISTILHEQSRLSDQNTNPGFVILKDKPPYSLYQRAVRSIVEIEDVIELLRSKNAQYILLKNGRGIIGATSAIAWSPERAGRTYELITYREPARWGTKRIVDEDTVKEMDRLYPTTFDNYDYENRHNRIKPNSPCPILYGIRGVQPEELLKAYKHVKSEDIDSWLIFETNQGTDDHITKSKINQIKPYHSVKIKGEIVKEPITIKGGHVIVQIKDDTDMIDCAAYEPTKQFRNIIRQLIPGDRIEVYGGVREYPLTINIEKIRVLRLTKQMIKMENPICKPCNKHMKSIGKNQGYRCIICGRKKDKPVIKEKKRGLKSKFYEVPICARRHLSKPVKLITKPSQK
ncbi:MAG: tRNA(Ile)(2)-agmatinylcytidine synthase [Candidatus Thermoplasmatota archaeon]